MSATLNKGLLQVKHKPFRCLVISHILKILTLGWEVRMCS